MTTQHTPGPWTIRPYNFDAVRDAQGIFSAGCRIPICHSIMGNDLGQADANARLIAAAPELLAALQRALDAIEYYHAREGSPDTLADARAAIARATGGAA